MEVEFTYGRNLMALQTRRFQVLSHRMEHLVAVFHCPDCGKIYHFGKYRIEGGGDIICHRGTAECSCGKTGLPFPKLFNKVEDVKAFYKQLGAGVPLEMSMVPASAVEMAFADPKFFHLNRQ